MFRGNEISGPVSGRFIWGKRETSLGVKGPTAIYLEGIADNFLRMKTGIPLQQGDAYIPFVNSVSIFSPLKIKSHLPTTWAFVLRIYSLTLFSFASPSRASVGCSLPFLWLTDQEQSLHSCSSLPSIGRCFLALVYSNASDTCVCLRITWRAGLTTDTWVPFPPLWFSGAKLEPDHLHFPTRSQGVLMLLFPGPTLSNTGLVQKARPLDFQDRHSADLFLAHLSK